MNLLDRIQIRRAEEQMLATTEIFSTIDQRKDPRACRACGVTLHVNCHTDRCAYCKRRKRDSCRECGESHSAARRQAILARVSVLKPADVYAQLEGVAVHLWGPWERSENGDVRTPGRRMLERDLAAVRSGMARRCAA